MKTDRTPWCVHTSSEAEFSIEKFFKIMRQGKIAAAKCRKCNHFMIPPKPVCGKCFSRDLTWVNLPAEREIVSFSEVHVSNDEFQKMIPYVVAVVRHSAGINLVGIIRRVTRKEIQIGTKVKLAIDPKPSQKWPHWPRYYYVTRSQ